MFGSSSSCVSFLSCEEERLLADALRLLHSSVTPSGVKRQVQDLLQQVTTGGDAKNDAFLTLSSRFRTRFSRFFLPKPCGHSVVTLTVVFDRWCSHVWAANSLLFTVHSFILRSSCSTKNCWARAGAFPALSLWCRSEQLYFDVQISWQAQCFGVNRGL